MSADKPRRLGRGLEALLGAATAQAPVPGEPAQRGEQVQRIAVASIRPNPYQPRKEFRAEDLADLEASLKASGLLQPITLRKAGRGYELIAGERRFRAAFNLGWTEIPAIVREVDDTTLLTLALVENLQRADLNPLEEAEGYKRLVDEFDLTQQQVADVVGKDRTTVVHMLRLLTLPEKVRGMLGQGLITTGHARALLALDDDKAIVELANQAVALGMSVRELERRVREEKGILPAATGARKPTATVPPTVPTPAPALSPHLRHLEDRLRRFLQTDVSLQLTGGEKGSIKVAFYSGDDLERLLELIMGDRAGDFAD
ncbi:MAG: ParB/RepB/Spo0J family partition protein [Gemmatimonadaceae bacterium]